MLDILYHDRPYRPPLTRAIVYLFIQGHIDSKAKGVFEFDFLGEDMADFFGGGCWVDMQADIAAVH